ncbi:MAG: RNA-binding protein [Methanosarcinaceae archaeon]|nr:RNA-binding protein [Methanosarcinaceae archaeon]
MKKIYVGGIPFDAPQASFMEFVEHKVGPIADIAWIVNRQTNEFRGFAFLTFQNEGDDLQAMLVLNGMEFEGRILKVSEASPRPQR